MEQNQPQDYLSGTSHSQQQNLPNATTVLVLGILSIVVCFITGIVALVISKKDMDLYRNNPTAYSSQSYNNLKAGRICAIIGIVIQVLGLIAYIAIIAFFITAASTKSFN